MHRRGAPLRLALTAVLAVLLAVPAVGLSCPPEMRETCPLMAPPPQAEARAPECPMGGTASHDDHGIAGQTLGRGIPSCCVSDSGAAPLAQATVTTRIEAPASPAPPAALPAPLLATAPEVPAVAPAVRAPSTPLYTLHSSLLR